MALFGRVAGGEVGGEPAIELANEVAIAFRASDDKSLQDHSEHKSFRACLARPHRHLQLVTLSSVKWVVMVPCHTKDHPKG